MDSASGTPGSPTIVVVGASGGIGSATAAAFLERGTRVVGMDRLPPDAGRPPSTSLRYRHLIADVTDPDSLAAGFADAAGAAPLAHVVVLAGGAHPEEVDHSDLVDLPHAALKDSVLVNLTGSMFVARAALPYLRRTGPGASLTFTSSINATAGIGLHAYSAAKAGVVSLARTLAVAEGASGVRVNVVLPGTVVTPRTRQEHAGQAGHFAAMEASTVLGRTTTSEQVAAAFVALALDLTAVTGQSLTVDAGQTARWR